MAKFSDFIEALHNDLSFARASSDFETVKLAKEYAENPYLRSLDIPVPRMKVKNVDIEMTGYIKLEEEEVNDDFIIDESLLISKASEYFKKNLRGIVKDKESLLSAIESSKEDTLVYSNRYIKDKTLTITQKVNKITEYFIKSFDKKVVGITNENEKLLNSIYQKLDNYLIKSLNIESKKRGKFLDFEFSENQSSDDHQKINFRFTIVEDDLIWEVDKIESEDL